MTLRPARRRRYALSQYATVRGFSLWQQEWFGFFFLGAVGVRLTIYCTESIRDFGVDRVVIVWCETMYRKLENPG